MRAERPTRGASRQFLWMAKIARRPLACVGLHSAKSCAATFHAARTGLQQMRSAAKRVGGFVPSSERVGLPTPWWNRGSALELQFRNGDPFCFTFGALIVSGARSARVVGSTSSRQEWNEFRRKNNGVLFIFPLTCRDHAHAVGVGLLIIFQSRGTVADHAALVFLNGCGRMGVRRRGGRRHSVAKNLRQGSVGSSVLGPSRAWT
jgi:hypothetical protein